MVAGTRFLVVEFTGEGLLLAEWTRDHPGTTIDLISEPVHEEGGEAVHPSLMLVRGVNRAALVQLMDRVDRLYGPINTLSMEAGRGRWLARIQVRESQLHSAAALTVTAFQHRLGIPWTHLDDGVVYLRAQLPPQEDAELLVQDLEERFRQAHIEAQIGIQEFGAHDYSVWDELVQASIGLSR